MTHIFRKSKLVISALFLIFLLSGLFITRQLLIENASCDFLNGGYLPKEDICQIPTVRKECYKMMPKCISQDICAICPTWQLKSKEDLANERELPNLRTLAEQGNVDAQYRLGTIYSENWLVKLDEKEAYKWHSLAAAQGNTLSERYVENRKDREQKQKVHYQMVVRKLAENGNPLSQTELAKAYEEGKPGIEIDLVEAVKWYRKAAAGGDIRAQIKLSSFYRKGTGGIERNPSEGCFWLMVGYRNNNNAQYSCYFEEVEFSPEEMKNLQDRARIWREDFNVREAEKRKKSP